MCFNHCLNSAADMEIADYFTANRLAGSNKIIQDLIGHVFVEYSLISVGDDVELQRFELDNFLIGYVCDSNRGEIGLSCFGADRGKLGARDIDLVFTTGVLVWKCL